MRTKFFRLLAGLLGVMFLFVISTIPGNMGFENLLMCGLMGVVFILYSIFGEHPFVYSLLGVRNKKDEEESDEE